VNFTNTSKVDPNYGPITYAWDFGDGSPIDAAPNPVHPYPALGSYTVTLTVTNGACSSTSTQEISLVAELADFTVSKQNPCKGEPIIISAIKSNPNNIRTYNWTIGAIPPFDGDRDVQTLFDTGSYAIQLTIIDRNGCTDTKTSPANYIVVTGPSADFLALDTGGCKNSTIRFSDVTSPSGTITKWKWNFGDVQSQTFTTAPFTHKYTDTGYYAVQLIVTDSRGCTDSLNKANVVRITAPAADFYAPKNLFCAGGVMPFKDSSSGLITSYNWSFGDGGSSILKDPTHTYSGPDSSYSVKLVVTDTVGCQDSTTKLSYVQIRSPKPGFDAVDTASICPPLETKFSLKSLDYESFFWDFGDGNFDLNSGMAVKQDVSANVFNSCFDMPDASSRTRIIWRKSYSIVMGNKINRLVFAGAIQRKFRCPGMFYNVVENLLEYQ